MIRRGYYCKYKGKIYKCSTREKTVLLKSNDEEDILKRKFQNNERYQKEPDACKIYIAKYIKEVPIKK